VARCYQAADVYAHAARTDTFPNSVLEALACGTAVVATAVGGIPEQVKGLRGVPGAAADVSRYGAEAATGILVPPGDAGALAAGIECLLRDDLLCQRLSGNAGRDARQRFDLERQVDDHLRWYEEIRLRVGRQPDAAGRPHRRRP
jgi:glycosyltransferase involved in cell wall biosynthesis